MEFGGAGGSVGSRCFPPPPHLLLDFNSMQHELPEELRTGGAQVEVLTGLNIQG